MIQPQEVKLSAAGLSLIWSGQASVLNPQRLRSACRCAECQSLKLQNQVITLDADLSIQGIELIGQYAVQLIFSDGHQRGIYPWPYLYALGEGQ